MVNVTNIERFTARDGPSIHITLFLKGCSPFCLWCANPETQSMKSTMSHNAVCCVGCRLYERACPHQVIMSTQGNLAHREDRYQRCGVYERVCLQDTIALQRKEMTLEAIMAELCRDRDYYENSSGGITFSGGEPLVQQETLWEPLRACKQEGLHTAVETTGNYSGDLLIYMTPLVDPLLFDFKYPGDAILRAVTGTDRALIKENLRHLLKTDLQKVIVCILVIPVFSYEKDTLESALRYLKSTGVCEVNLLSYYTLGKVKYEKMGRPYTLSDKVLQKEDLMYYLEYARQLGMQASIGGQGCSSAGTHGTSWCSTNTAGAIRQFFTEECDRRQIQECDRMIEDKFGQNTTKDKSTVFLKGNFWYTEYVKEKEGSVCQQRQQ